MEPTPEEVVKNALEMLSMLIAPNRASGAGNPSKLSTYSTVDDITRIFYTDATANNPSTGDLDDLLESNLRAVENCEQYRNLSAMNVNSFAFPIGNDK